jgi:hypothetical protein
LAALPSEDETTIQYFVLAASVGFPPLSGT